MLNQTIVMVENDTAKAYSEVTSDLYARPFSQWSSRLSYCVPRRGIISQLSVVVMFYPCCFSQTV
jgi:hypothetical protein